MVRYAAWLASCICTLVLADQANFSLTFPFPALPKVFSAIVEANIVNKNKTVLLEEGYDWFQKKSYRVMRDNYSPNQIRHVLEFHNSEQEWVWLEDRTHGTVSKCQVHLGAQLPSISKFLQIGATSKEIYNGTTLVRGIRSDVWVKPNVQHEGISLGGSLSLDVRLDFNMYWYFAASSWTFDSHLRTRAPLRVVIRGTHTMTSPIPLVPSSSYNFEHYYDFYKFEEPRSIDFSRIMSPGSADWTHACDTAPYCQGTKYNSSSFCAQSRAPPMPKIPDVFETMMEMVEPGSNSIEIMYKAYDDIRGVSLLRTNIPGRSTAYLYEKVNAHESWTWDDSVCMLRPIGTNFTGDQFENGELASPERWFGLVGKSRTIWQGKGTVRGLPAQIWVTDASPKQRFGNLAWKGVKKFYFLAGGWRNTDNTSVIPLMREDMVTWSLYHGNGTLFKSWSVRAWNSFFDFNTKNVDVQTKAETLLGNWRARGCDVREFCAAYPRSDVCLPVRRTDVPKETPKKSDAPKTGATLFVVCAIAGVLVGCLVTLCVQTWYRKKRGYGGVIVPDSDDGDL